MIVLVDDGVFASRRNDLDLMALLRLGFEGRHFVQTQPPWEPGKTLAVNRWLAEQSPGIRELAELALSSALEEAVRFPPALTVSVVDGSTPQWNPPRLPLGEALRLLERPLKLLVEDAENDDAFLRTTAPKHWRSALERSLAAGWIEVEHGGGIPRMLPRLRGRSTSELLRLWVLFDSDAREPDRPSAQSEELREVCEVQDVAHHQLRRRAAENYLPLPALAAWAKIGPRNQRKELQATYLAFKEMEAARRHHYHMRGGFAKDEDDTGIPTFFGDFARRPELRHGFGRNVRGLFKQEQFRFQEEWLRRDGQQEETSRMVQAILRYV